MNDLPESIDALIDESKLLETIYSEIMENYQNETQIDDLMNVLEKVLNQLISLSSIAKDYCSISSDKKAINLKNICKICIDNLNQCKIINNKTINTLKGLEGLKNKLKDLQTRFDNVIEKINNLMNEINYLLSGTGFLYSNLVGLLKFGLIFLIIIFILYSAYQIFSKN
eukprot:TRINITY_DN1512_c0_g1_i1.p1 TRINITY_DN1512_c0_g1~~TRINITY_DN1512_c0_g1_i1.p1  ORF type:complete len:181 (+),score=45.81 TRINITY_DN1512_c0_g1_i1:38-544(+)